MKRRSKLLILVAVAAALCCLLVMMTSGANASGTCGAEGDNLTWTFDSSTGKLTIRGTGAMKSYDDYTLVPWYSYRSSIQAVEIAEGVTSIGDVAFWECRNPTSIEIPSSVTSIGNSAFRFCNRLTSIEIPSSVTSIGDYAFDGCSSLYVIYNNSDLPLTIGSSEYGYLAYYAKLIVDKDGNKTYKNDGAEYIDTEDGFLFRKQNGKYQLTAYFGKEETVTLPDDINGNSYEIYRMCGVHNVIIPSSVTSIGDDAFSNCSSLTSIEIPSSVTSIGNYAFFGCERLTSITVDDSNPSYQSIDGILFSKDQTTLVCYPAGKTETTYTIPEGVTSIEDYAFDGCESLTSIEIPSSVISIGGSAFFGCERLTSVIFGENSKLTSIGNHAFYYCRNLTSIEIPDGVTSIGYRAFDGCYSLTSVTFGENSQLTSIGDWAFKGCSSLTSVIFGENSQLTSIGSQAFSSCESLTSITIPESVTEIGNQAFYGCSSLYVIYNNSDLPLTIGSSEYGGLAYYAKLIVDKDGNKTYKNDGAEYIDTEDGFLFRKQNGKYQLTAYFGKEETVTLPDDINGNSYEIYRMCGVHNVIIPSSVTSIGDDAFSNCSSLTSIEIPSSVTSIGHGAFSSCSSLTSIEIPSSVTSIGSYAFSSSSLTSIEIPSSVTSIGDGAFDNCDSLTSIEIPSSVTSIGDDAFSSSSLTSVTFGENSQLTSIGSRAFSYCSSLTSIDIPSGVTSIGGYAFNGCSGLTSITVDDSNPFYRSIDGVLFSKDQTTLVCYPAGKTETTYTIPEGVTSIGYGAFSRCSSLTSVTFGENSQLTSIGNDAFYYCRNLTSIDIPSSVTSIGDSAFYYCDSLTSIEIPSSVTSIGSEAFAWSYSLTSIEIPSSVTSIGFYAFKGCLSLTSIEIPSSVTSIGNGAFYGCISLTSITILSRDVEIYDSSYTIPTTATIYGYVGSTAQAYAERYGRAFVALDEPTHEHTYGEWEKYDKTQHKRICSCGDVEYAEHTWDNGEITTEPTSTSQGVKTYTCTACGATKTEAIPPITISSGTCGAEGDNLTWSFDSTTGKLIISGTGEMEEYSYGQTPWYTYCNSIQMVEISEEVTSIGQYAFSGCEKLISIVVSENNPIYQAVDGVLFNKEGTLLICYPAGKTDAQYTVPQGVTSIGDFAFSQCSNLTRLEILGNVSSIGTSAFSNCTNLVKIVVSIDNLSFQSIDGVLYTKDGTELICYPAGKQGSAYVIPNGTTLIRNSAFQSCYYLTSIEIPKTVTTIMNHAFDHCVFLTNINFAEDSQLVSIGSAAFQSCLSLTTIDLPDSTIEIGLWAFNSCGNLTNIEIPSNVVRIGDAAFFQCKSLTSIIIYNKDCVINDGASFQTIPTTATIYGYAGSTAQAYAEKYSNEFVALTEEEPYAPGDVNGDETINSDDAIYLLKHTFLPEQYPLSGSGDMNGDGKVDSDDAVYLLKHTFLPEQYPLP